MKKLVVKNLAAWLAVLLLSCGTVLAAYAPGTGETAPPAEEAAELQDAAGNVTLAPYTVNGVQRGYYVAGCASTVTAAVIPAEYQGLPVLHIGKEAFRAHKNLTSVVIPDSVETIGEAAFCDCYSLSSFTLPASAVFQGPNNAACYSTESLAVHITKGTGTMPDYKTDSADIYKWTPWYSASWYGKPTTVVIDDGVKNVGAYAFCDGDDIQSVTAGADLAAVGDYGFYGCSSMANAAFISQLDSIGVGAFQNCKTIPEAVVKAGVTAIPASAFQNCQNLKTVVLPDSVAAIGEAAFCDCYSLSSFTLPASAVFQGPNNAACYSTESLAVHITKGTGTMP
ncbi:MAG: leucine-rich repeat domain-containing protein, partial [Oscillibacter sp.]|nr:leucine-rich repeat domain-containing protein [Oscillibacter sp.]